MKEIQWRDTMRSPQLYFVDLRLFVLMLAWAFWPRLWTLVPVVLVMGFLVIAGHKGYRPGAAVRAVRRWMAGPPRAFSPRRYRRIVDYGVAAVAAVVVAAGTGSDVRAEFHYVPPAAPAVEEPATLAVVAPAGEELAAGVAAPEPEPEPPPEWKVMAGSTLGEVLAQWGARAEVEVVMLTDREYLIGSSHTFRGEFEEVVRALLFGLGHLRYAPIGQLLEDGRVLAIYHRVPDGTGEAGRE